MSLNVVTDFSRWQSRLSVDELELSDIEGVERYCAYLIGRYPRLHVLINNAAQVVATGATVVIELIYPNKSTHRFWSRNLTPRLYDHPFV